jgi:Membrane transporters of cations and cationic drugs
MAWIILIASAFCEAIWATALGLSEGFTNIPAVIVFFVATIFSMVGLARAVKTIPIGTAYAVWTGIGAALTVTYAVLTGVEPMSLLKGIFLAGIILSVIGLKLAEGEQASQETKSVG